MPLDFFPFPMLLGLTGLLLLLLVLWRKKHSLAYLLCLAVFVFYILAVVDATLFPIPFWRIPGSRTPAPMILSRVNLVPLNFGRLFDLNPILAVRELGGNILLTIPFGFGLPVLMRFKARSFPWLALGCGLAIELSQLMISLIIGGAYRSVDINDVLLNAVGTLIGYGLFRSFSSRFLILHHPPSGSPPTSQPQNS